MTHWLARLIKSGSAASLQVKGRRPPTVFLSPSFSRVRAIAPPLLWLRGEGKDGSPIELLLGLRRCSKLLPYGKTLKGYFQGG
jgi:hypothetical protein